MKIPIKITEQLVRAHPEWIFIYSNDYLERGCFGQAAHLGGTGPYRIQNAYRVPTCYKYCANVKYFTDTTYEENIRLIDECFVPIMEHYNRGVPVIVLHKIGEGCSQLNKLAPLTYKYLKARLDAVVCKDIVWDTTPQF